MTHEQTERLRRIVTKNGKFGFMTNDAIIDQIEFAFNSHSRICDNLQIMVQKYDLGLGGERIDELVCAELERLKSK